jgi:hypothetical protein
MIAEGDFSLGLESRCNPGYSPQHRILTQVPKERRPCLEGHGSSNDGNAKRDPISVEPGKLVDIR